VSETSPRTLRFFFGFCINICITFIHL
jgi:hypothetical protein